jgi:hypothetical protein
MSYHPGSNLAGEDGYGLRGMNPETTSTDRSTSTLHSTSMTRTCPTSDPFSTFPEDDSESGESLREVKSTWQLFLNQDKTVSYWLTSSFFTQTTGKLNSENLEKTILLIWVRCLSLVYDGICDLRVYSIYHSLLVETAAKMWNAPEKSGEFICPHAEAFLWGFRWVRVTLSSNSVCRSKHDSTWILGFFRRWPTTRDDGDLVRFRQFWWW